MKDKRANKIMVIYETPLDFGEEQFKRFKPIILQQHLSPNFTAIAVYSVLEIQDIDIVKNIEAKER